MTPPITLGTDPNSSRRRKASQDDLQQIPKDLLNNIKRSVDQVKEKLPVIEARLDKTIAATPTKSAVSKLIEEATSKLNTDLNRAIVTKVNTSTQHLAEAQSVKNLHLSINGETGVFAQLKRHNDELANLSCQIKNLSSTLAEFNLRTTKLEKAVDVEQENTRKQPRSRSEDGPHDSRGISIIRRIIGITSAFLREEISLVVRIISWNPKVPGSRCL